MYGADSAVRTVFQAYNINRRIGTGFWIRKRKEEWTDMKEQRERLISEGNAFYEIDLECIKRKEEEERRNREGKKDGRKQREEYPAD